MAKKQTASTKSTSKKTAPKKKSTRTTGKSASGKPPEHTGPGPAKQILICLIFVAVCLGIGGAFYLIRHPDVLKTPEGGVAAPKKTQEYEKPNFEVFSETATPDPQKTAAPGTEAAASKAATPDRRPRVAIIIDDMGYDRDLAAKFISLDAVISFAILPYSPHQRQIASMAHRKGCPVMLHMPMEPREFPRIDPGPGAVFSDMSPDERIRVFKQSLDEVPYVCGVNNHMGSAVTADSTQMNQILSIVKKRGLFFVDSRTSADTRVRSSARLFQVPFAERDIFLDHVAEAEKVRAQIKALVRMAEKKGQAVGIGHPHAVTYEVLADMLPAIKKRVKLVPAADVVRVVGP